MHIRASTRHRASGALRVRFAISGEFDMHDASLVFAMLLDRGRVEAVAGSACERPMVDDHAGGGEVVDAQAGLQADHQQDIHR